MDGRLPAHVEVGGLIRRVQAEGGFATVLKKGERDAGTIIVVVTKNGADGRIYERMPQLDGTRPWHCAIRQAPGKEEEISGFLERRGAQDPDVWIVELDIDDGERFIDISTEES